MVETGLFYSIVIDPILKSMRRRVAFEINHEHNVIDVACGTGAQAIEIAQYAKHVVGIDISESMISQAKKECSKRKLTNIEFFVADASNLNQFGKKEFDIATMTLALHQFSPANSYQILTELKRVARKIIIVDYTVPLPKNFAGKLSHVIEFLAGRTHNRHFKQYYEQGGLNEILTQHELMVEKSVIFGQGAFQLVICTSV